MSKLARSGSTVTARARWGVTALAGSAALLIAFAAARGSRDVSPSTPERPAPKPAATGDLSRDAANASAELAARAFASSYVSFLYGRRAGAAVTPTGERLYRQLLRARSTATPAEFTRALVVRDLTVNQGIGRTATGEAVVDDGTSPPYALSFNLTFSHRRWVVSRVQTGDR